MNKELLQEIDDYLNEKLDRCARIAKRKYRVWPSAYASGAAVKCRKGKIWRGVKEEIEEELQITEEDPKVGTGKKPEGSGRRLYTDENPKDTVSVKFSTVQDIKNTLSKEEFKSKSHQRQSQIINLIHQRVRAAYENAKDPETKARLKNALEYAEQRKEASKEKTERMREMDEQLEEKKKRKYKPNFKREKEQGLHGWFARNQGKGWVNCRTGGPCGRESADKGGKYPACRPTMAQCKSAGKGPLRKKKSSKQISWTGEGIMNKEDILKIIKEELAQAGFDKSSIKGIGSGLASTQDLKVHNLQQAKTAAKVGQEFTSREKAMIASIEQILTDFAVRGDLMQARTQLQAFLRTLQSKFGKDMAQQPVQEGLKYHIETKTSLFNPIYRPGSKKFNELMLEAKQQKNHKFTEEEQEWLSTDVGLTGIYEGQVVPLDLPLIEEETLSEAEYKGKQVPLGKPQRGGSKKFYVYVKDGDRVKKISFGDPNLSVKVGDPKRRASFVARHNCKEKNDRLTAGYWSCRIGRYPHLTGAKQRYTWW